MNSARTLVDADILLDLVTSNSEWADWSLHALNEARRDGGVAINPIVYAEVSVGYARIEDCDAAFPDTQLERLELPWAGAFLAGKIFLAYRKAGGLRLSPLPDFYIGAHAAVAGLRLLTRDAPRYRTYFPGLELMTP